MASRPVPASRAAMKAGAAGGKSVMADTTRGRAHVPAQLGLARVRVLYSALPRRHPPAPGAARLTVLEIKEPGLLPPRAGGGLQLLVYQLGVRLPLCR